MRTLLLFALFLLTVIVNAQVGIGTTTPNGALDITSSTNGVLIPRVSLTSTNVAAPVVNPNGGSLTAGTLVWNTATAGSAPNNVVPGYYFWNGSAWSVMSGSGGSGTGWSLTGNGGASATSNFIGTTDNVDVVFKRNSAWAGSIGETNTSFGNSAFNSSSTGLQNSAFGYGALASNTTGGDNMANGYQALFSNSTGFSNTTSGSNALFSNSTGFSNTASGVMALYFNTTGGFNTANGFQTLFSNTTGQSNAANGNQALYSNTTGSVNAANGCQALYLNTAGNNNTANGNQALSSNTTGSNNIGIGYNSQVPNGTANNQVRIGDTNISYAGIQVAWTITSDRRLKSDINKSELGLGFIKKLNPVSYVRLNDSAKKIEYGFIAQEVEETLKSLDISNAGMVSKDDQGMYSVRYNDLFAPMVKALQEQQGVIEADRLRINALENINKRLEARLKAIEDKLK